MSINSSKILPLDSPVMKVCNWILDIVVVIVLGLFVTRNMGFMDNVNTRSMEPTLSVGESVLVNRMVYKISHVKRFDIIMYEDHNRDHVRIKRVIGLPGETVSIKNGEIYIDDEIIDTGDLFHEISVAGIAKNGVTLKEDEYFVLGDWIEGSSDSRFEENGNVYEEDIVGKVWFRVAPMKKIGVID